MTANWDSKLRHSLKRERAAGKRKGNALMASGAPKFLKQIEDRERKRDAQRTAKGRS